MPVQCGSSYLRSARSPSTSRMRNFRIRAGKLARGHLVAGIQALP